ncbi:MAG TPA: TlpA disulfide reductase family protein [Rhizomicrobium sp.]|nr:TlpA disulfide reductase family protein [Rhizomicrobium sp.]
MRKIQYWAAGILGGALGALLLLIGAMWLSEDVRYGVIYALMERIDLNAPVPPAMLARQIAALKHADLVDENGKRFDLRRDPHAVIWLNEWAYWCVPCRMEFPAMTALEHRVGRGRLRVVLFSQPQYWEKDKRAARELGLDFEMVTIRNPTAAELAAIDLGKTGKDFLLPEHSFFHADGRGIEAMHTVRDWDSAAWQAIVEHWHDEGAANRP